jgi:hypothetical protein
VPLLRKVERSLSKSKWERRQTRSWSVMRGVSERTMIIRPWAVDDCRGPAWWRLLPSQSGDGEEIVEKFVRYSYIVRAMLSTYPSRRVKLLSAGR